MQFPILSPNARWSIGEAFSFEVTRGNSPFCCTVIDACEATTAEFSAKPLCY